MSERETERKLKRDLLAFFLCLGRKTYFVLNCMLARYWVGERP